MPCTIFSSFQLGFSLQLLYQCALLLLIAVAMSLLALATGYLFFRDQPNKQRSVLRYGTLVTNSAFVGLPVINGMYGEQGLLFAAFFIIPNRILMWSAGVSFFIDGKDKKSAMRQTMLSPAMISVYMGVLFMIMQCELPSFLNEAVEGLGSCTTPLAMILVGATLANERVEGILTGKIFFLVFVRQLLLPLICFCILKCLPVDLFTLRVSVLLTGMPIGSTTVLLAQKYGADSCLASKCVLVSTLTAIVTVPVISLLL